MAYLKKQNLFKRVMFSRSMALFLIFLIVFMGYGLVSLAGKSIEAAKARRIAESQATDLKAKQADLSAKLDALNTQTGEEAALREQFPVVKPGEHMVVITGDTGAGAAAAAPAPQPEQKGFWNYLKSLFQ